MKKTIYGLSILNLLFVILFFSCDSEYDDLSSENGENKYYDEINLLNNSLLVNNVVHSGNKLYAQVEQEVFDALELSNLSLDLTHVNNIYLLFDKSLKFNEYSIDDLVGVVSFKITTNNEILIELTNNKGGLEYSFLSPEINFAADYDIFYNFFQQKVENIIMLSKESSNFNEINLVPFSDTSRIYLEYNKKLNQLKAESRNVSCSFPCPLVYFEDYFCYYDSHTAKHQCVKPNPITGCAASQVLEDNHSSKINLDNIRYFRDNYLKRSKLGQELVTDYYSLSGDLAHYRLLSSHSLLENYQLIAKLVEVSNKLESRSNNEVIIDEALAELILSYIHTYKKFIIKDKEFISRLNKYENLLDEVKGLPKDEFLAKTGLY